MSEYYSNVLFKDFHNNDYIFIPSGNTNIISTTCIDNCILIINKKKLDATLPFHYKKQFYNILSKYIQCHKTHKKCTYIKQCNKINQQKCILVGVLLLNDSKKDIMPLYFYKSLDDSSIKICNLHNYEIFCDFEK